MKNNRSITVCFVYNSVFQSSLRLLLYVATATIIIIALSGLVSLSICLLCIPLALVSLKLSAFAVFSAEGIKVCTFFAKPFFLPWDAITHYGTVTKNSLFQSVTYVYFSVKALVTAPYEPIPKLCRSVVCFSNQQQLGYALSQHWDPSRAKKLIPIENGTKATKNKLLHIWVSFYFVWLFRVLGALTDKYIWLYLMYLPGIYIAIGVFRMIYNTENGSKPLKKS